MIGRKDAWLLTALAAALLLWVAPALLRPGNALANFGDLYAYHIPLQHLAAARLESGELPFWNPYIFSGMPHLANPQTALFYPPAALLRLFPLAWAFSLYLVLHLALAGAGAHLLARRLGAGPAGAAALAAAYTLSPFVAGRVLQGVPTLLASLAWVPWCWLALHDRRAWLLAGTWALQGLSGHPQFAAVNAAAMALWAAAEPRGRGRTFAAAAAAAVALALIQAVPAAALLARSSRAGLPEAFTAAYSMPPKALVSLLVPGAFGTPAAGTFAGDPSEWFEEYTLQLGAGPLVLAAVGAAAMPAARLGLGLAAAGAALAAGRHAPWWPLWRRSPLAALSRVPARWGLWTLWGLWLAAAVGWARFSGGRLRLARGAAAVVILIQSAFYGAASLRVEAAGPYLAPNRAVAAALGGRLSRALTAPELPNADKTMLYRIMNVNGYEAFYPQSYAAYAARAEGRPAADPSRVYFATPDSAGAKALGVSAILPGPGGAPFGAVPGAEPLARFSGGGAPSAASPRPELWRLDGAGKGVLTLAVAADPGWRAWADGAAVPVTAPDGVLMVLDLPRGVAAARLRYEPPCWGWLCAAAVLSWAAWGALGREALTA
ncbi:MAG: DUF2079 domain-containing protein [Elusimicrobia bacterium]|nr:DUF2079 domain-containing protein [Elusimicrobiota bacterium]